MLEAEIQRLTAAVEALTEQIKSLAIAAPAPAPAPTPAPAPKSEPEPKPVKNKEPAAETHTDPKPPISKEALKDLAIQITRADTDAKVEVFAILSAHKVNTITALPEDPDVMFDVFTRLNNLADRIAKEAE